MQVCLRTRERIASICADAESSTSHNHFDDESVQYAARYGLAKGNENEHM